MISFFLWYLLITMVGLATFPLVSRLFSGLSDRGYTLSRALGLLVWGYSFWMLASLGLLQNDPGGVLLALIVVVTLSIYTLLGAKYYEGLRDWAKQHIRLIVIVEALFLVAFAGWALVRAYNPDIVATEKPMELAFLNAIMRSVGFPPHDPWLSGHAISYYYFGYVMVAMLAQLTYTSAGVAFNLGISLIFALSAVGAYGLVYNLLAARDEKIATTSQPAETAEFQNQSDKSGDQESNTQASSSHWYRWSFLGSLFVLIISNLAGLLEVVHARGLFWRMTETGEWVSTFWTWLDMKELSQPPTEPFTWMPTRYLWWWRASRVISDYDLTGGFKEVIDEFPFFSYLLADLHPHVLAMPFVLLAIALALNLFLRNGYGKFRWLWFRLEISSRDFWLAALLFGGLAFLNTWDFPIYVALFAGVYGIKRILNPATEELVGDKDNETAVKVSNSWVILGLFFLKNFFLMGLTLGVSGILLYLPFYLTFSSQAGGVLPNLINPTRGAHFWVMFGSLLVPMLAYLIYLWKKNGDWKEIIRGMVMAGLLIAAFWMISLLMGRVISVLPLLGDLYLNSLGAAGRREELFVEAVSRRLSQPGGWLTLLLMISLCLGLGMGLIKSKIKTNDNNEHKQASQRAFLKKSDVSHSHIFVLILVLFGSLVVLTPEFFFLRDHFGTRMNTVFKFYYQAWLLWAIASAFGVACVLSSIRGISKLFMTFGLVVVLGAGLVYPTLSLWTKTNGFNRSIGLTLDGTAYLNQQAPDELEGINWLKEAPLGVLVEAIGGSYSIYGRVAAHSGQPSILNWPFHQVQWRGSSEILGTRQSDVQRIYSSNNWGEVETLLRQYGVRYIYVGSLERNSYRVNEYQFMRFLVTVFQNDSVTIYQVPWKVE